MPEADQTDEGEYEFLKYHTFDAVEYDRDMAWKAGNGWIAVGPRVAARRDTDRDDEDVLRKGQSVVVWETDFKLKPKT